MLLPPIAALLAVGAVVAYYPSIDPATQAYDQALVDIGLAIGQHVRVTPTEYRFELPPEMLHDALAFASLLVGDSQTMAAEAAVLGTPNLRVSSWKGRLDYLEELEHRFGLTESFSPDQGEALLTRLDALPAEENPRGSIAERQRALFDHKCDVAEWYTRYVLASL